MKIQEQIQQIIARRQQRLPAIDGKLETLDRLMEQAQRMEATRDGIFAPDGTVRPDSAFASMLDKHPDMVWELQALEFSGVKDAAAKARKALEAYRARCARQTVNISVVGRARIGKSALLKSISGLNDKVIPAFDSTDCTGAPSVIYNVPGAPLKAHLTFKSREDMRRMAQTYLDKMIPDADKRPLLQSAEQIRSLDLAAVHAAIPPYSSESNLLEYLQKLVEHCDGDDGWLSYAGAAPLDLYDEDQIVTFVAQNNGKKTNDPAREEYFKYLAVDTCEITCSFPQEDLGPISLIDTVGLGDRAEGIQESMLKTVTDRSDAVVVFHRPESGAGGGIPKELVENVYGPIEKACAGRDLDSWLFWFINHVPPKPENWPSDKDYPAVNTDFCTAAVNKLKEFRWPGADSAKMLRAVDAKAVQEEFLLPLLCELAEHLDSIDKTYRDDAEAALKELQTAYSALCARAQKVLCSDIRTNASLAPLIHSLSEEAMTQLRKELFVITQTWRERRDQPCVPLSSNAQDIFRRMQDQAGPDVYLPSQQEILSALEGGEQPSALYIRYADSIRNQISQDFLDVDVVLGDVIGKMKDSLAAVMYEKCGLEKLCPPPADGRPAWTWFNDFAENILGRDYPNIRLAMETAARFDFTVKGFLTYEVRRSLDELDMLFHAVPQLATGNLRRTAVSIFAILHQKLGSIAAELQAVMEQLCVKPNRAMYAEVADFCDRIYYSDGVKMEWRNFFADRSGLLWADELKNHKAEGVLFQEWIDLIQGLQEYNTAAAFRL